MDIRFSLERTATMSFLMAFSRRTRGVRLTTAVVKQIFGLITPAVNFDFEAVRPAYDSIDDGYVVYVQGNKFYYNEKCISSPSLPLLGKECLYLTTAIMSKNDYKPAYKKVASALEGKPATFVILSAMMDGILTARLLKTVVEERGSTDGIKVILVAAADCTPVAYRGGADGCYQSIFSGAAAYEAVSGAGGCAFTTVETSMWFAMGRSAPSIVLASMPPTGVSVWGTPRAAFQRGNGIMAVHERRYKTVMGVYNYIANGMEQSEFTKCYKIARGFINNDVPEVTAPAGIPKRNVDGIMAGLNLGSPISCLYVFYSAGGKDFASRLQAGGSAVTTRIPYCELSKHLPLKDGDDPFDEKKNSNAVFVSVCDLAEDYDPVNWGTDDYPAELGVPRVRQRYPRSVNFSILLNSDLPVAPHTHPKKSSGNISPARMLEIDLENSAATFLADGDGETVLRFFNTVLLAPGASPLAVASNLVPYPCVHFFELIAGSSLPAKTGVITSVAFGLTGTEVSALPQHIHTPPMAVGAYEPFVVASTSGVMNKLERALGSDPKEEDDQNTKDGKGIESPHAWVHGRARDRVRDLINDYKKVLAKGSY